MWAQAPATPDRGSPGVKPSVLLADDHPRMLESASRLLSADFEIVGAVSDGRQAVDSAQHLQPDVVVLDITMPGLDGFQTVAELQKMRSRAAVVFLTMHRRDEYVAAALRSGAQGYVLKTRMHADLIAAIRHALAGRLFVPSVAPLSASTAGWEHTALFYLDDRVFLHEISTFAGATLRSGAPVVIAGTEATRLAIADYLRSSGLDLVDMERRGQYLAFDAVQSLGEVMRHEQLDGDRLAEMIDSLERSRVAYAGGSDVRLTLIGELAALLWRKGNVDAVLQMEQMWNRLTRPLPIFTVCCYPIDCIPREDSRDVFGSLCDEHRAITQTLNA